MADRSLKTTIWAVVIIFLLISGGAFVFLMVWIQPRHGGAGIKVAVLDSGINMDARIVGYKASRELKDAIIAQKSFITTEYGYDTNETIVDDTQYNHGTLVALQIASRSIGIAPEAQLIIAKCADNEGTASYPAIFAAIDWVIDEEDADIINISLGGPILENDTIVEKINRAAKEKGVLVVISSGNSGDVTGYSTSSIEGPGDALQAITVGATTADGIAEYSSIGPLKDHSIKPDLVDSGFTIIALGTSFAAPKVAAKAAVLMSWCNEQGYDTSPGMLKAALMQSASLELQYPIYYSGAGVVNVTAAKTIITNAQKINNMPMVYYVMPDNLPFTLTKAFRGDVWTFPLTIVSPVEQQFNFTSNLASSESIVSIPSSITLNQTGLVNCKFIIPSDHTIGTHEETISIESKSGEILEVSIDIEIEEPLARIGFDIYHSVWQIDHLFGQFRELNRKLADEGIALIELNHQDNFSQLNDFDALIIADPNSFGLYLDADQVVHSYYKSFENSTIDNITDYVDSGHGLFVMATSNDSSVLNETNRLINNFNITVEEETIPETMIYDEETGEYNIILITNLNSTHPVTQDIVNFDYYGSSLSLIGDNTAALAWAGQVSNVAVGAFVSTNDSTGRVVVSGSNFMADNFGINAKYNSTHNLDFILNVVEWITNTTLDSMVLSENSLQMKQFTLETSMTTNSISEINIPSLQYNQLLQQNFPTLNTVITSETIKKKYKSCF